MAFYARNFIFDDIPSEEYGLIISSDGGSVSNGHNVELITDDIYRRHTPYFYGVRQADMITMEASIRSSNGEITAEDSAHIQKWLFGQTTYKELRIVQGDMEEYFYKCFLLAPRIVRVGNLIVGYDFTIQLDSPFAYGEELSTTLSFSYTSASPQTTNTTFLNVSDNNYYTYPTFTFEASGSAYSPYTYLQVTNNTDGSRIFQMGENSGSSRLDLNEYIIIDNDLQSILSYTDNTMTTETTEKRIQDLLNGYFFRLLSGGNSLSVVSSNIEYLTISYTPLKRIT